MNLLSVLVVSGGGFQGFAIVKCLRESSAVRVVVANNAERNVPRYFADAFHRVPNVADTNAFVSALLEICSCERVGLVLPSTDWELNALSDHRHEFEQHGIAVAVSGDAFLRLAHDKRELYAWLHARGFPVLPVIDISAPTLRFPLIGKPRNGWGGRDQIVLHAEGDFDGRARDTLARTHVFQDLWNDFDELSIDFAIDFHGRVSRLGCRRRDAVTGGFAVMSRTVQHAAAERVAGALAAEARNLGARGVLNLQLLCRGDDVRISDVNPRVGTSIVHWLGTGFNPVLFVCASIAPFVDAGNERPKDNRRTLRYLADRAVDARELQSKVRGLVFDLDDTLLDQKAWIVAKLELLDHVHAHELPTDGSFLGEALRILEEEGAVHLFDRLAEQFEWNQTRTERLIGAYRASQPKTFPLYPDVPAALESFRGAGLSMALLTDNPPASQRQKLTACGLLDWFDAVVFTREAGREKPDGVGFAHVASLIGLEPGELAMIGNNPYRDVLGARAAAYGALFLIQRRGALVHFDAATFERVTGCSSYRRIEALQELWWYVDAAGPPQTTTRRERPANCV